MARSRSRSPDRRRRSHSRERKRDRDRRDNDRERDRKRSGSRDRRTSRSPNERRRSRSRERKERDRDDHRRSETSGDGKSYGLEKKMKRPQPENAPESQLMSSKQTKWGKPEMWEAKKEEEPVIEKKKVDMGLSGKLTEETNTFKGVVIKYNEPPEAKKPTLRWRLYPFKGEECLPVLHIHRQSAYLIGRERKICDLPVDHPSCSKQHAVLQYRTMPYEREDGSKGRRVMPYIIDLGSSNGTFLNGQKIDPQRYYELREKDMLKFGFSTREFVLLREHNEEVPDSEAVGNSPSPS